jgi:hypothetical protein
VRPSSVPLLLLATVLTAAIGVRPAAAYEVLLSTQGEYLDGYLVNGKPFPPRVIVGDPDPHPPGELTGLPYIGGRHVNGQVCFFPPRARRPQQFVVADDTYREACIDVAVPQKRCAITNPFDPFYVGTDADGWAIFDRYGNWTGEHLQTDPVFHEPASQGAKDPQGCVFDSQGRLFATDVGSERADLNDGSLLVFFPGDKHDYKTFCFLDKELASPGMPAMDGSGNIYIPEPQASKVTVFSGPFPSSAHDCENAEHLVVKKPGKRTWLQGGGPGGLNIPVSITRAPRNHWYVAGAIFPPIINEYDAKGNFVRNIVPADVPKNPLGMAVGRDRTLYYAELNLDPVTFGTRCGSVSMVRFDAKGDPLPPVTLGKNLGFPDGLTIIDSTKLRIDFKKLREAPENTPDQCGGE